MYKVKYKTKVTEHEEDKQEEFSGCLAEPLG